MNWVGRGCTWQLVEDSNEIEDLEVYLKSLN